MKVYIYNQNCVMAGRAVPDQKLEQHENPDEAGDWTMYEGDEKEIEELARLYVEPASSHGAGTDRYWRRVATTLLESLVKYTDAEIHHIIYGV